MLTALLLCAAARVVDGDTIACGGVRIRMAAIDAPDKMSSRPCRLHYGDHVCDDVRSAAATTVLKLEVGSRTIRYRIVGQDTLNNRPVARFFVGRRDLQCFMLAAVSVPPFTPTVEPVARYIPTYDKRYGYPLKRARPAMVRRAWR